MPSILFVCTANRYRSPLAAALLSQAIAEVNPSSTSWTIGSAGTWAEPGLPVLPAVVHAAATLGLDLTQHRSTRVSGELLFRYDLILVMQASQKEALQSEFPDLSDHIYLLANVVERGSYDIPDWAGSEQDVGDVSLEMNEFLRRGRERICVLAVALHNQRHRVP